MADEAVSLLVRDLLFRLTSPALQKFRLLRELEVDISALKVTLEQIQAVLQDAEEKQRKQKAIEVWLKSIRSASLEAENVLDEVLIESMLRRLHAERGIIYRLRAFLSFNHNQLMVRNRITNKVKNIGRKLDAIAVNKSNFDLNFGMLSMGAYVGGERRGRETSSLVHLSKIYGRDAEIEMITQKICNEDITRHYVDDVRVYAIWGMGGVGKTTLAQLVYNHEMVKTHFELKSWVYVSTEFEIEKLTRGMIESITGSPCKLSNLDSLQICLQGILRNKRFLIVLDDVWIGSRTKWDEVSKALSCGAEGSIVMVTTRSQQISTMMAKVPEFLHKVGCLSKEDSWSLFKMLAFGVGREGEDVSELEPIGMEIVEKCKGLPLAVKALGSLMWSKCSAIDWQLVKESDLWELQRNEVYILPALELSYNNLLPHMKRCFAYCCLFPKGYEMAKDLLIQLWVINGFIPAIGDADLYTLGEEIFDCLCLRSFFQDVKKHTSIDWVCKMHDLMHDLARYVMKHHCSVIEPGKTLKTPDEVLHLGLSCPDFVLSDEDSEKLRFLRSIFIFRHEYKGNFSHITEHKYLRVLHLIGFGGMTLPESIGELKHLRYLNLSGSNITALPESIIYLQNLQVLILHSCLRLLKLPKGIRYLRNLQCFDIRCCNELQYMPAGIKELRSLQRCPNFIVGENNGAQIGELGDLNLLGRELEIQGLKNVQSLGDVKSANLKSKRNLISLVLRWNDMRKVTLPVKNIKNNKPKLSFERAEEVLDCLEPSSSLKELEVHNYPGKKISPGWMVSLRNLVKIKFWGSERCETIPPLGKLQNLKVININDMPQLRCFHDEDYTGTGDDTLFPSLQVLSIVGCFYLSLLPSNLRKLEKLHIHWCPELESLPSNFSKLKELDIKFCHRLRSLPAGFQSLENLTHLSILRCGELTRRCEKEKGEDWPIISHVPNIDIIDVEW